MYESEGSAGVALDDRERMQRSYAKHLGGRLATILRIFGGQVEHHSHGAALYTEDGEKFVNCAGYGALLHGATNDHVVEAVVQQVRKHPLSARVFVDSVIVQAAEALMAVAPQGMGKVYFTGSGTEATECAMKLARAHGHRRLVAATNGYHGRTMGSLSISARPIYQEPFRPLLPDVVEVPFNDAAALERALDGAPPSLFIVEPVQGEGGVIIPDPGYLAEVSRICKRHHCLLVIDEILTGLGRLGQMWGIGHEDVHADMVLVGKSLSGGVIPVAALLATDEVYAPFERDPLLHQSTFSGAPVAMAAARAALEALDVQDIVATSQRLGHRLLESFRTSAALAPPGTVREVRGKGLLLGIEFTDGGHAGEMMLGLVERNVLANHSANNPCVIRFLPPAVIDEDEVAAVEDAVEYSFRTLGQG